MNEVLNEQNPRGDARLEAAYRKAVTLWEVCDVVGGEPNRVWMVEAAAEQVAINAILDRGHCFQGVPNVKGLVLVDGVGELCSGSSRRNARIAEAVDDMARPDQPLSVQDHAQNVLARAGLVPSNG